MVKKFSISFILFCAFGLFLVHNIIPHHHHEVVSMENEHQADTHDDNEIPEPNDNDHPPLDHLFFHHTEEFGKVILKSNDLIVGHYNKVFLVLDFELPPAIGFIIKSERPPPHIRYLRVFKPDHIVEYHSACHSLRGPPVIS